jgi:hypothetical protein
MAHFSDTPVAVRHSREHCCYFCCWKDQAVPPFTSSTERAPLILGPTASSAAVSLAMMMTGLLRQWRGWAAFGWAFNGSCIIVTTNVRALYSTYCMIRLVRVAKVENIAKKIQPIVSTTVLQQSAVFNWNGTTVVHQKVEEYVAIRKGTKRRIYFHFCIGSTRNFNIWGFNESNREVNSWNLGHFTRECHTY